MCLDAEVANLCHTLLVNVMLPGAIQHDIVNA